MKREKLRGFREYDEAGKRSARKTHQASPNSSPTKNILPADVKFEEAEVVKIAEKHLAALTKLLAIPLPLVFAVMIALATTEDAVKIIGLEIPHRYAEYAARTVVLLVFVQCSAHLLVLVSMVVRVSDPTSLRRSIAFHPGTFNPFFGIEKTGPQVATVLKVLLAPALAGKLAIGFMMGFVQGFRVHFSSGLVSHWYRIGSYAVWPFSKDLSQSWGQRSHEIVQYYIGPVTGWEAYADALTLATLFVSIGMIGAIVYVTDRMWPNEGERAGGAIVQLIVSGFAGWLTAILLSNAIGMKVGAESLLD